VVSLRDFEDAAREYEGIAKARARMVWNGEEQEVSLVVAADNDADIRPEDLEKIYKYLNTRRDTNRKLRIVPRIKVPIAIGVEVKVASDYLEKNVLDAASETLRSYFAFENIDIGQDIFLSDIYKALQGVEGLNAARISKLQRRSDLTSGNVRKRMLMHSEEMAAITEPGDISVVFWG
jgi:phage-related baseplate assembly protein